MNVSVGSIITNSWIRLLLLSRRHDIPIHVVVTVLVRRMLMLDMVLVVVVVVEVVECRVFCRKRLLLLGMLVGVSREMLLCGNRREGVVVGRREW